MTVLKLISILVCVLIVAGYLNRKRIRLHVPLMAGAFVIDMAMVLYIELSRGAIESARAGMGPLMIIHICLSSIVIALYIGQIITGIRKARGTASPWHGNVAVGFILARLGNLITSFLVTW